MPKVGEKIWYKATDGKKYYEIIDTSKLNNPWTKRLCLNHLSGWVHYSAIVGGIVRKVKRPKIIVWYNAKNDLKRIPLLSVYLLSRSFVSEDYLTNKKPDDLKGWVRITID